MKTLTRLFAIAIIATFLSSIPLAFANNAPDLVKVVNVLNVADFNAKPGGAPGGGKGTVGGYTTIANGLKGVPVNLYIQTNDAKDPGFLLAVQNSIAEWNSHSPKLLFSGNVITDNYLTIETASSDVDYKDELAFGVLDNGIIAQTTTWITRAGKQIVDFDIVFNINYAWGNVGPTSETNPAPVSFYDTQNIATHEIGHGIALGDLYQPQWATQTMYGYGYLGETCKRTLESGDIAGIQAIYGR
jgi:hypothetical protein